MTNRPNIHWLMTDGQERHNLAADPRCAGVMAALVAKVDAWDRARSIVVPTVGVEHKHRSAHDV